MKKLSCLFIFLSFLNFSQDDKFILSTVAFYNVENLFDAIDDPKNSWDQNWLEEGTWTEEIYQQKLKNISRVIPEIGFQYTGSHPAVVGLCEVENRKVLIDLVQSESMKKYNYNIIHFDSPDERGIDVALLFDRQRFKPRKAKKYPLYLKRQNGERDFTRDQLLVEGFLDGEKVYLIVNHWPSRSGGQMRSEPARIKAGQLNKRIIDSIQSLDPKAKVISMGDFNDDPKDKSIKMTLNTSAKKNKLNEGQIFNPFEILHRKGYGTLKYRGNWNMLDQLLMTEPLVTDTSLSFIKAGIYNEKYLITPDGNYEGYPYKSFYNVWLGGYSDHFPVFLILGKKVN